MLNSTLHPLVDEWHDRLSRMSALGVMVWICGNCVDLGCYGPELARKPWLLDLAIKHRNGDRVPTSSQRIFLLNTDKRFSMKGHYCIIVWSQFLLAFK
jgi:hypothetical protein